MLPINDPKYVKPKFLRQLAERGYNGPPHIFPYSDKMALRDDMVAHWPDGDDPNVQGSPGLAVDGSSEMARENEDLRQANESMRAQLDALSSQVRRMEGNNHPDARIHTDDHSADDPARNEKIRDTIHRMVRDHQDDQGYFTSAGHPRVDKVEELSGLSGLSRASINVAMQG